ncbi:MAG: hypothetical protein NUW24_06165 [Anaerolineae bacterium]|jgi:hypothetical protein|nr:hypothetical protein [Anaerolineae bacterium]MDH7475247.1 hypothetical protein [Anaerolineae bacterium]
MGRTPGWPLVALFLGVALGLALGLTISWGLWPVQIINADPVDLRAPLREDYLVLIGQAYSQDGDLGRARQRLAALGEWGRVQAVTDLAARYAVEGRDQNAIQALTALADALSGKATVQLTASVITPAVQASPSPSPTATHTAVPAAQGTPTITPTATPRPPVRLVKSERICSGEGRPGYIMVYVQDQHGLGLPNVEIRVSWATGEDRFFTGLKPDIDPGYADFEMQPGVSYQVRVGGIDSEIAGRISAEPCAGDGGTAAWRVIFQRGE